MIKLHQFPPVFGRNVSPFTLKLETWLRLAQLPYQGIPTRYPGQGPKGKLPFIEDDDGTVLGDSSLIIEHPKRTRGIDLDAGLDPSQRAQALALQRLIEDHLYFIRVWSRWVDPAGWRSFGPALFGSLPPVVRQIMAAFVRRRVRASLQAPGLGRHSPAALYAMDRPDLEAISAALNERPSSWSNRAHDRTSWPEVARLMSCFSVGSKSMIVLGGLPRSAEWIAGRSTITRGGHRCGPAWTAV